MRRKPPVNTKVKITAPAGQKVTQDQINKTIDKKNKNDWILCWESKGSDHEKWDEKDPVFVTPNRTVVNMLFKKED